MGLFDLFFGEDAADAEPVVPWERPVAVGADGQPVRPVRARRWLDLGHPDLDAAIVAAVGALVRRAGHEPTLYAVADRIATAAVAHVRAKSIAARRVAQAEGIKAVADAGGNAGAAGRWMGETPPPPAEIAASHRIDRATVVADPCLAAFLAALDGDDDRQWKWLLREATANRWRAVRRWRQIGAGLLGSEHEVVRADNV